MTKIVVVSDNHGRKKVIFDILEAHFDADAFFHCGDSEMSNDELKDFHAVEGNNDYYSDFPMEINTEINGYKIHVEHGHMMPFFGKDEYMKYKAMELKCDIFLTGHTHIFHSYKYGNTTFVNPGSLRYNRDGSNTCYAIIWIKDNGDIEVERIEI